MVRFLHSIDYHVNEVGGIITGDASGSYRAEPEDLFKLVDDYHHLLAEVLPDTVDHVSQPFSSVMQ
ncbi:MAG: hypothetical protein BWY89_01910 [Bacteroidetes bacterium ADurb.BinA012]|nr:MAG: hypothetical protein BWY89_01910 [Bacteroidetes bacterium ADurb.BinA012]